MYFATVCMDESSFMRPLNGELHMTSEMWLTFVYAQDGMNEVFTMTFLTVMYNHNVFCYSVKGF